MDATLEGQKTTFVNVYAPNTSQPEFFHEVCNLVRSIGNDNIIIGGDFNQVRDMYLDKSSQPRPVNDPACAAVDVMMEDLGLVDVWKLFHPQEKDYTFFSHPHSTYSRIDYLLISHLLVSQTLSATIGNIVLTDHAPVDIAISATENIKSTVRWRLNNLLLNCEDYCDYMRKVMKEFWEFDDGLADDIGITWDAFKAFVRGRLIQYSSRIKKAERDRLQKLEQDINELEKQHMQHPEREIWSKLIKLKYELNNNLQKKVE